MNIKIILKLLGLLLMFLGLTMIFSLLWSLYYDEKRAILSFIVSILVSLFVGGILYFLGRSAEESVYRKEALAVVSLGWILSAGLGSLPFIISGSFNSIIDAYFEAISGFTTTGASVLTNIEILPKGILFWRSFTHWLGGMGIIVLFIAILPQLGMGAKYMFKLEAPGPVKEGLKPRIKETAITLWQIYVILSTIETILLMIAGMNFFDALCHTFGTMATGGYSTKNASIAHYNSVKIDIIIIVFMVLAGTNFSLYFYAIRGEIKSFIKDTEFKVYISIIIIASFFISIGLYFNKYYNNIGDTIRYSIFQVTSILTTTGYCTANFDEWSTFAKVVLIILMFVGGCAGSTGGGMKVMRMVIVFKYVYYEIYGMFSPQAVFSVKLGKSVISEDVVREVTAFVLLFIITFVLGSIIMSALGLNMSTAVTSTIATLGNIGPGLSDVGATGNYANIPPVGKIVLCFCMVAGRLELYTILALLMPSFWK